MSDHKITTTEILDWASGQAFQNYALEYFADVLNGEYSVEDARSDCLSTINNQPND